MRKKMRKSDPGQTLTEVGQTSRGCTIYREPNDVGGYRYWSDSIPNGVVIWDTSLVSEDELLTTLIFERKRSHGL